jgi:flagellar hook assembly protein FlgD
MNLPFQVSTSGSIHLKVYNLAGELVRDLAEGTYANGSYLAVWDGRNQSGDFVSSGLYLVLYESPGGVYRNLIAVIK